MFVTKTVEHTDTGNGRNNSGIPRPRFKLVPPVHFQFPASKNEMKKGEATYGLLGLGSLRSIDIKLWM